MVGMKTKEERQRDSAEALAVGIKSLKIALAEQHEQRRLAESTLRDMEYHVQTQFERDVVIVLRALWDKE